MLECNRLSTVCEYSKTVLKGSTHRRIQNQFLPAQNNIESYILEVGFVNSSRRFFSCSSA